MANNFWLGVADPVAQVTTITATGTWAADDTATITCNNKTVTVTIGSSVATTDVVAALAKAINSVDDSDLVNDETRNRGGYSLGEFRDMVADSSGSVLTLTSATAGTPFVVTRSEVTAGSGALGAVTEVTAATGKNHGDNTANWSEGSLPAAGEPIIVKDGAILYGLDNTTLDLDLDVQGGSIGLPLMNTTHSGHPYKEYRQRFYDLPVTATTGTVAHKINVPNLNVSNVRVDFGTNDPSSGQNDIDVLSGNVEIVGGKNMRISVWNGTVVVGNDGEQNASEIYRAYAMASGADVLLGDFVTYAANAADNAVVRDGKMRIQTDMSATSALVRQYGGRLEIGTGVDLRKVAQHGGFLDFRGESIYALYGYGGTFDATFCELGGHTDSPEFHKGYTFKDPYGVFASVYTLIACKPSEVTIELPDNSVHTLTTASSAGIV